MIYTTREININGSTATIDEDIYLFKQDSNIELKFIINDTRFTFQTVESSNVIESSNASYFRVKLLNPYGKTINFPIQEVTDNYIVLLINGELIDEDTEVGDYTIQIRLYDKDKNSKLTLPAIVNCIHIQQPIFSEVEENTVDTAAIDTASVMMSDEGELPVVDSTGKYIPTLWNTGDTISKAKINHIEKGILQAHSDALAAKIPQITPPEGHTTSDIVTLYNELPENGLVYFIRGYIPNKTDANIIGLCSTVSFTSEDERQCKNIACFSSGVYVNITSDGDIIGDGMTNEELDYALNNPNRKKGQVLTMLNDVEYGWGDAIPQITPPTGTSKSDLANLYNELPESGLVFFTSKYVISNIIINGLCGVTYMMSSGQPIKYIICYESGMGVIISSTGNIPDAGFTNPNLDTLIGELESSDRQKGQVFTMKSDSTYGWANVPDTIPQITPPKGQGTSDIITIYNELPERGLVYFTDSYYISDALILGLCYIDPYTDDNNKPAKTIICTSTVMYVNITSTGDISGTGVANYDLDIFVTEVLKNPDRKKGQVLTMTSNSEYGWADTTPKFCINKVTDSDQVQLTLDSYQLIEVSETPTDLSTPTTTKILQLPDIEESDKHVYKIHVLLMGSNSIVYRVSMPPSVCGNLPNTFVSGKIYECIFTYLGSFWLCQCIEYERSDVPV